MKKDKEWLKNEMLNLRNNNNRVMLVTIGEVMELIYQLDEPAKIIIPQFVADWWDGDSVTMYGGESINKKYKFRLISEFHDRGLGDYSSKVEDWLDENDSAFLDLVNGKPYEVEKEKLYYTVDEKGQTLLFKTQERGILRSNGIDLETVSMVYGHQSLNRYQLTEKEIKDYDERYFAFAVPVEVAE